MRSIDNARGAARATPSAIPLAFYWLVFIILLAYYAYGIVPVVPIEGDDLGIVNGAIQMEQGGLASRSLAYRYEVQSGTYTAIRFLHRAFNVDILQAFGWLSGVCSLLFVVLSAWLVSRLLPLALPLCGVFLLLFQEVTTSGYYANSTVAAALFSVLALLAVTCSDRLPALIAAGILFGIAAWMRLDVLVITPATLVLLYREDWKHAVGKTAIVAAATVATTLITLYSSGGGIEGVLKYSDIHLAGLYEGTLQLAVPHIGGANVKSLAGFFSVLLAGLLVLGLFVMAMRRDWRNLLLFVAGTAPFFIYYFGTIVSPKYLYYLLPFFLLASLYPLLYLNDKRKAAIVLVFAVMTFIGQYPLGLRTVFNNKPYVAEPFPTLASIVDIPVGKKNIETVSLVLGAGSVLTTDDGYRLTSGWLFAPVLWHHHKRILEQEHNAFEMYFSALADAERYFLTTGWVSRQTVIHLLLNNGYQLESQQHEGNREVYRWRRGGAVTTLWSIEIWNLSRDTLIPIIEKLPSAKFVYLISHGREQAAILESGAQLKKLFGHEDINILAAYEVDMTRGAAR